MNKQAIIHGMVWMTVGILSACMQSGPAQTPMEATSFVVTKDSTTAEAPVNGLVPERFDQYIGINYPPLPDGLSENFGLIIQDTEDFGLSLVTGGGNKMLWFSKISQRDSSGRVLWELKDILDLSGLEPGIRLIPDGCFLDGVYDNEIFAAGRDGKILQAWRANTTLEVFEVIPITGIECQSDKVFGLE